MEPDKVLGLIASVLARDRLEPARGQPAREGRLPRVAQEKPAGGIFIEDARCHPGAR